MTKRNLIGERYGSLVLIEELPSRIYKSAKARVFACRCDCGAVKTFLLHSLKKGTYISCGCIGTGKRHRIMHGLTNHPLYHIHEMIVQRCYNPNVKGYKNYGGRGIDMSEEWRNHPEKFIEWAIENGWRKGLDIDRIDNNKGYSPNNCRATDRRTNSYNKRTTIFIEYNGESKKVPEWSKETGILEYNIRNRILSGWEVEDILNVKIGEKRASKNHHYAKGKFHHRAKLTNEKVVEIRALLSNRKSLAEIARRFSVSESTISSIRDGKIWKHVK